MPDRNQLPMLHKTAVDLLKRGKDKHRNTKIRLIKQWEEEAITRCTLSQILKLSAGIAAQIKDKVKMLIRIQRTCDCSGTGTISFLGVEIRVYSFWKISPLKVQLVVQSLTTRTSVFRENLREITKNSAKQLIRAHVVIRSKWSIISWNCPFKKGIRFRWFTGQQAFTMRDG